MDQYQLKETWKSVFDVMTHDQKHILIWSETHIRNITILVMFSQYGPTLFSSLWDRWWQVMNRNSWTGLLNICTEQKEADEHPEAKYDPPYSYFKILIHWKSLSPRLRKGEKENNIDY
jgi:hypothetical protein